MKNHQFEEENNLHTATQTASTSSASSIDAKDTNDPASNPHPTLSTYTPLSVDALEELLQFQKDERKRLKEEEKAIRWEYKHARKEAKRLARAEKRAAKEQAADASAPRRSKKSEAKPPYRDDRARNHGRGNVRPDTNQDALDDLPAGELFASFCAFVGRAICRGTTDAGKWIYKSSFQAAAHTYALRELVDPDVRAQLAEFPTLGALQLLPHDNRVLPQPTSAYPPLILIHGLGGSAGNFALMRLWLRWNRPRPVHVFDYRDAESMEDAADAFGRFIDDVADLYPSRRLDILAHSMGGLISRLALLDSQRAQRVAQLTTLGTPHQGSSLARLGGATFVRELRPDSSVLARLKREEAQPLPYPLTSYWSKRDVLVLPAENAQHPLAENLPIHESTHLGWLIQTRYFERIFEGMDADVHTHLALSSAPITAG